MRYRQVTQIKQWEMETMKKKKKKTRPLTEDEMMALIHRALDTNRAMDEAEHANGFATPRECTPLVMLATGLEAVYAGIAASDWDCVAQGYCLLTELKVRIQQLTGEIPETPETGTVQ